MKRILATAALTATVATGASAATEAQVNELERFLPDVNISMLDDATVDQLIAISSGGESFADRQQTMRALVQDSMPVTSMFTEAQLVEVRTVVPDLDVAVMSDAELLQAISFIRSEDSPSSAAQKIRALVDQDDEAMLMLTDAEIREIRLVAPEFDLTTIDADDATELRAAVATGDRDRVVAVVESIETM